LGSFATVLKKVLVRKQDSDPIAYSIIFSLFAGTMITLFGIAFGDFSFPSNIIDYLPNLIIVVLLYGFGGIYTFKAMKHIETSSYTILFSSRAFFTIIGSAIFLDEVPGLLQLLGALLIFAAIIVVNLADYKFKISKGELYILFAAAAFGLENTNDRYMLDHFELYPFLFIAWIIPALFMLLLYPRVLPKFKLFLEKDFVIRMVPYAVLYAISSVLFFEALRLTDNSSRVAAINITDVIITVILSVVFLKEKGNKLIKFAAALLTVFGVGLITL